MTIREFIPGLPAQQSPIISAEIRNNFLALNDRTNKIQAHVTIPASTKIKIDSGIIHFSDNIIIDYPGELIDLGDSISGVAPFTSQQVGWFRDIILVLSLQKDSNNNFFASGKFVEGPSKFSSTPQSQLVILDSVDVAVAHILVRNNGNVALIGSINPITTDLIFDYRGFINSSSQKYYSASVGNRVVVVDQDNIIVEDGYGNPTYSGISVGDFTGNNSIQQAIDYVSSQGGGSVFIKSGLYLPQTTIEVPSNIMIVGEGNSTIIQRQDIAQFEQEPLFRVNGDNVKFRDLHIQSDSSHLYGFYSLIIFNNSSFVSINQCKIDCIDQQVNPIELISTNRCSITNNVICNGLYGVIVNGVKTLITNNQFDNIYNAAVEDTNGTSTLATNNIS